LRNFLLSVLSCFTLTHCVYYGDIHGHSSALDTASLNVHHTYTPPRKPSTFGPWNRFHDPQLNQLICVALSDSPTIARAEARVRQAAYLASGSAASLWPSLNFSGYIQRQRFSERGLAPPPFNGQTFNITTQALNFNYEFDFWGKNRERLNAAIGEQCAAIGDANQARLILAAAVADTYFQLLGLIAQTQLAAENANLDERLLHIAADRQQHGVASAIPVNIVEEQLQATKLTMEQYRQAENLIRHQLAVLLGKNPWTTDFITQPQVFHFTHVQLPPCLPANLLAQRPDLHAAKSCALAHAHLINVAKAQFYPNINLNVLFSYQNVGLVQVFSPKMQNNAITAAVDLPIFDAGLRRANLGEKYAEYDLAVSDYNQTLLTALREVADQLTLLRSLNTQLRIQNHAVATSDTQVKLNRARFQHGIIDTAELLQSQQILLQQKAQQINLQTRHLQAVVGMLTALGGNDTIAKRAT